MSLNIPKTNNFLKLQHQINPKDLDKEAVLKNSVNAVEEAA